MSRLSAVRLGIALAAVSLFVALLGAASATAATVVNGNFETGTLEGWSVYQSNPKVGWFVEEEEEEEEEEVLLAGRFAASQQEAPGTTILSQDVALEAGASHQLKLTFGYFSLAPIVIPNPDTLDAEGSAENQQVRVDVVKPNAPIASVDPSDILATVYMSPEGETAEGEEGFPSELEPQVFTADLSAFAGQTVRLRVAVAVTTAPLFAVVDDVSVASTLLPTPAPITPQPQAPAPSNIFTRGKLTLNKKNGTGFLSVTVPGAGVLTATDARRIVARASNKATGKKPPLLIKTASVTSTGAGTVKLPIAATATGKKILAKKGKLNFKVELTFAPNGGTTAVQPFSSRLVKTLKRLRK